MISDPYVVQPAARLAALVNLELNGSKVVGVSANALALPAPTPLNSGATPGPTGSQHGAIGEIGSRTPSTCNRNNATRHTKVVGGASG